MIVTCNKGELFKQCNKMYMLVFDWSKKYYNENT